MRITRDVDASGLGSSAAEHVLAYALRHPDADLDEIAEAAFASETAGGVAGGRQDQYAACYGGLSFMSFGRDAGGAPVHIERLEMPEAHLAALQKRLVLVDSGVARLSGEIHDAVWAAYARHDDEVTGALLALKQYGRAMRDAIAGSDFGGIRHVLAENWIQQKRLHPSVTNDAVDAIFGCRDVERRVRRQGLRRGRRRRPRLLRLQRGRRRLAFGASLSANGHRRHRLRVPV